MKPTDASVTHAFRILGQLWLEEVRADDVELVEALPDLATSLSELNDAVLTDLAVEYQNLFGFNVPPYESVFVDPSSMLMAPATGQVQALYRRAGWRPPSGVRTGAVDHIGLELLALADWYASERDELARELHTRHLALWVPVFVDTLQRLTPHPFYATLADLTCTLLLTTLPLHPLPGESNPFPELPPPPVYIADGMPAPAPSEEEETSLNDIVRTLLTPRNAGLYIARQDIAEIGRALDLPGVVGERHRMMKTLFRLAGQYDQLSALHGEFVRLFESTRRSYENWAAEYSTWAVYGRAWKRRLHDAQTEVAALATVNHC